MVTVGACSVGVGAASGVVSVGVEVVGLDDVRVEVGGVEDVGVGFVLLVPLALMRLNLMWLLHWTAIDLSDVGFIRVLPVGLDLLWFEHLVASMLDFRWCWIMCIVAVYFRSMGSVFDLSAFEQLVLFCRRSLRYGVGAIRSARSSLDLSCIYWFRRR